MKENCDEQPSLFKEVSIEQANQFTSDLAQMVVVDVHSHMYPPRYMELLRSRKTIPYVRSFSDKDDAQERLVILPSEDIDSTSRGRPVGPEYHDVAQKIAFMDKHDIDISVVSLANPWLDWLDSENALRTAQIINDDMERLCATHPGRLYAFGTLPFSAPVEDVVSEIDRLSLLPYQRGVIMGTSGFGQGLDDPRLEPVFAALERQQMLVFLHPHYGISRDVYGPRAGTYGHVLPLALGFPMETTIAITRMLLCGVWDRFPLLKMLVAHSGGTLPFLAGRIESCIQHDAHLQSQHQSKARRSIWDVLKNNIYLDGVIYDSSGLRNAIEVSGSERVMFGTDHPFFPPVGPDEDAEHDWPSVTLNVSAVRAATVGSKIETQQILGRNAMRVLAIPHKW